MIVSSRAGLSACIAAVAFALSWPAAAESLWNAETFTLANGMTVVVVPDHRAPVVTHMVWYRVGAADEPRGKTGLAHFFEHLMFKGTSEAPGGTFSRLVARHGGRENAFTTHDATAYHQTVARDQLELMMRLEADRMRNLVLTDEAVETEREVILEERRQRIGNEPGALLGEHMAAVLYLAHPYGNPVIGWEHEIRALTPDDIRSFYDQHYRPNNAILVVAGDATAAQVRPLAEKYYGALAARTAAPRFRVTEPEPIAARRIEYRDRRVRQPSWRRSYIAPSFHAGATEHVFALVVLAEILGGGPTSRLYQALVVERKVAAHAGSFYSANRIDLARMTLFASPLPGGGLDEVEAAVEEVVERFIADGVDAAELARAKTGLVTSAIYARDNLSSAARVFGGALAVGRTVADVEAWPERIAAVTAAEIRAAARHVLRRERSVTGLLLPEPAS